MSYFHIFRYIFYVNLLFSSCYEKAKVAIIKCFTDIGTLRESALNGDFSQQAVTIFEKA